MDLIKITETFSTQEACIAYLEHLRWQGSPECPHCKSTHVRRRNEHDIGRIGRWNCEDGEDETPKKRGRGTAKDGGLGAIARGGKGIAQLVENTKGSTIANFIKKFVKTDASELYTDQYRGYTEIGKEMKHETLNRSEEWRAGEIHTNTIEGFWSFVKRAWYGSHPHYSTAYTPLYLTEACYKYNPRETDIFLQFLTESMEKHPEI